MNRSTLTATDVQEIVLKLYNLKVTVVKELDSYDDQNFYVVESSETADTDTCSCAGGYVLKVLNSLDSQNFNIIELQTQIILHVRKAGYPTSNVIPCSDGQFLKVVSMPARHSQDKSKGTEDFIIRLFSFIPGQPLDQVKLSLDICYEIGWFAGKMDLILKNFSIDHKPYVHKMTRKWNMSEIPNLRQKLLAVTNSVIQSVAMEVIDQFENKILACQQKFQLGLIHSDFNECNIIVDKKSSNPSDGKSIMSLCIKNDCTDGNIKEEEKGSESFHICGVVDFGDATFSLYIFEVSIAMTYVMLNPHGVPFMAAARRVLAGYLSHIPLSLMELQHLKLCVCARLVQSIVTGYFTFAQDPGNEYILTHASRAWPILKTLWEMADSTALQQLNEQGLN